MAYFPDIFSTRAVEARRGDHITAITPNVQAIIVEYPRRVRYFQKSTRVPKEQVSTAAPSEAFECVG
jgi:hypothetical protein